LPILGVAQIVLRDLFFASILLAQDFFSRFRAGKFSSAAPTILVLPIAVGVPPVALLPLAIVVPPPVAMPPVVEWQRAHQWPSDGMKR